MPPRSPDKITFATLQQFLIEIGFASPVTIENSLAFHHAESGTLVMLAIPEDGETVHPADLLSVLVRLENEDLASQSVLKQFRAGKLPLAS